MGLTEAEAVAILTSPYVSAILMKSAHICRNERTCNTAIINGVCLDPRIGTQYNNPSFGYGGYCLPKHQTAFS